MLAGMATQQWRRRHAVATLIAACAAAAVVAAAAAPDVPTRNSTAAAPAGAPVRPAGNDDGKAYHHVWPVIIARTAPARPIEYTHTHAYILWLLIQLPNRSVYFTY